MASLEVVTSATLEQTVCCSPDDAGSAKNGDHHTADRTEEGMQSEPPSATTCDQQCDPAACDSCKTVSDLEKEELVVGRSTKTRVLNKINAGAFGEIYIGELVDSGRRVAVKLELQNARNPQLMSEGNVYRHLEGGPGIPHVYWFGLHEPLYNVLVMDLLGPSLQDLFAYCGRKLSVKTTLLVADQILEIMDFIHKKHYVYRDIKPDNFMVGVGETARNIYVVDFGLAKKTMAQRFSVGNISCQLIRPLVGTVRYASLGAHAGREEGPRDDLESLGYVWAYFLRGSLPWQGVPAHNRTEKFALIADLKKKTSAAQLFDGFPEEFARYLDYARLMRKDDRPDYVRIREVFHRLADRSGIAYDHEFDWVVKERETGEPVQACRTNVHSHSS